MATTVTGRIAASLASNFSKDLDVGTVDATPGGSGSLSFTNGAGAGKVEAVLLKAGTIAGSGTVDIDLAGVIADPAGDTITMTKVKGILVKNTEAVGVGTGFTVGGTFMDAIVVAACEIPVHPGGFMAIADPGASGMVVAAGSADIITLTNLDATDQDYEIYVLGETT